MTLKLPKMKKSISNFLNGEEGQISKKAIVSIGAALSGVAAASAQSHSSSTNINYNEPNIQGSHSSSVSTTGSTTASTTHNGTTGSPGTTTTKTDTSGTSNPTTSVGGGGTTTCFPAGTQILMGDGSQKNIEDVAVGDEVSSYDSVLQSLVNRKVLAVGNQMGDHMCTLRFDDDTELRLTDQHPVFTKDGWKAVRPFKTEHEKMQSAQEHFGSTGQGYLTLPSIEVEVNQLQIGDEVMTSNLVHKKIVAIKYKAGPVRIYNLRSIDVSHTYFADGVLVHNYTGGGGTTGGATTGSTTSATTEVCFLAGTRILMGDGSQKNIEDVKERELVSSYDYKTMKIVANEVVKRFVHRVGEHLIINDELRVTPNHPLFVNGWWKEAGQIRKGDKMFDKDGKEIEVVSIKTENGEKDVYNLEIAGLHNYFAENKLVHNKIA